MDDVAVRLGGGERVADGLAVDVRDPVEVRVGVIEDNGDREPVGERLIVRVAVMVLEERAELETLTEDNGERLPVGVRVGVALTRAVFVGLGVLVGVHVGLDVAEGNGSPTANARRCPSTPGQLGWGDPRTPPPLNPGENPVRHNKRRRNRIL